MQTLQGNNPFLDPLCQVNLNDNNGGTVTRPNLEASGRPIFNSTHGTFARKTYPSKWDDAQKWLVGLGGTSPPNASIHNSNFADKTRVVEEKTPKLIFSNGVSLSDDKFPNEVNPVSPKFGCSQVGFFFGDVVTKATNTEEMVIEVKHRDIGTEMTPLGSSTTSHCPTPFKSTSPARHNTPDNRSGPLTNDWSNAIDIAELQECHLAKLQLDSVPSNWSSREEEEEEVSKSLRHFEMSDECRKTISESKPKPNVWEEQEKTKTCLRYQREEAKIQAWVNLQNAKAEAESRKLEVKIQKMRSNLEEKLMKRMADVHRKAEEWRAEAQFQQSEQIRRAGQQARKVMSRNGSHFSGHKSCGWFPCKNHHI